MRSHFWEVKGQAQGHPACKGPELKARPAQVWDLTSLPLTMLSSNDRADEQG